MRCYCIWLLHRFENRDYTASSRVAQCDATQLHMVLRIIWPQHPDRRALRPPGVIAGTDASMIRIEGPW